LGAHRSKFGRRDLDFVAGILIGPRFDFGEFRVNTRGGVLVGVSACHRAVPAGTFLSMLRASRSRNKPTSVTTPTAWPVPRSLTFVATAGLMSTQTILTQLGSMLPTAMECSMEPRHSTKPATRSWTE